jgi:N-acetyl-anhydromuramyl-L-alanine amidase AmpD
MSHRLQVARIGLLLASLTSFAACSSAPADEGAPPSVQLDGPLANAFDASAAKAGVPRDLLVAIAKVEDGLAMPAERLGLDIDNDVPVAGPLQLRRGKLDTLARGAALSGVSEIDLRIHADLALEAGALVLAELGTKTNAKHDDLASWNDAIEEMSGFADAANREHYAHQVFATLARGGSFEGRDGETIVLPKHDLPPSLTLDVSMKVKTLAGAEYPGAQFFPTSCTNKCDPGRGGASVQYIVVHDTEGGWNASVATLQNDPGKSVQYIVDVDGKVGQFVPENTTAYHAGNYFYNQRSVGIEHVGYATKPFPEKEYAASAKLVDYLAKKYNVARDRAHIIGHDQIPNGSRIAQSSAPCSASPKSCQSNLNYGGASHHTDPGIWEWAVFMQRFGGTAKCNDVTNLWNCSNDKTHAFRCAGGKVEVNLCDGPGACEVKPNGTDDVCNMQPKSTTPDPATPGTPADPPATAAPPGDDGAPEGDSPAPFRTPKSATITESPQADGGCSVTRERPSSASAPLAALGIALALAGIRRRGRFAR